MLRNILNLGGRLLIICLAAGLALAATYSFTAPVKAANEEAKAQEALRASIRTRRISYRWTSRRFPI